MRKITVTRTLTVNDVQFLVYSKSDCKTYSLNRKVIGPVSEAEIEKDCKRSISGEKGLVFITVNAIETHEELRGMSAETFYEYSERID